MLDIIVTNRHLCKGDFLDIIEKALIHKPFALLLREKDLPRDAYLALAEEVNRLCAAHGVPMIPHSIEVPGASRLHLPFHLANERLAGNYALSVSVHSVEEARRAEALGADFVIAGHIFETRSKPGIRPRGLDFLREICESVPIPVFAIGGITGQNAQQCMDAGAAGICRMSYWMEV